MKTEHIDYAAKLMEKPLRVTYHWSLVLFFHKMEG